MFQGIEKVVKGELDPSLEPPKAEKVSVGEGSVTDHSKVKLRPIHIMDIANLIGNNVVVGGKRQYCLRLK